MTLTAIAKFGIALVLLSIAVLQVQGQAGGLFGGTNQGDGTYYATSFGSGACSFAQGSVQYSPWLSGTKLIVAVNAPQYFGSQTCGLCLAYRGLGPGAGANPVPQQTQYAIVGDLCPECQSGDLDQAATGDGRWKISWYPVQCNVADSNFIYSFQGSNPYYLKLQVANTRVPVLSVKIRYNGVYTEMNRVSDNYFTAFANSGQAFNLPTSLQITSVLGDTVFDTLATSSPSGNVPGTVQFPLNALYETVGQSAPGASSTGTTNTPSSTNPTGPSPPVATAVLPTATAPVTPAATTAGITPTTTPAATAAPITPTTTPVATPVVTTAPAIFPPPSPAATRASTTTPARTPATTTAPTQTTVSFSPPPVKKSPPSPRKLPPPSAQKSYPPPPTKSLPSPPPTIRSPPPKRLSPPPPFKANATSSLQVAPYGQCGGLGAGCFGGQCGDATFPGVTCAANSFGVAFGCARINAFYWQCVPAQLAQVQNAGFANASAVQAPPSSAIEEAGPCDIPIGNNQQCGGTGGFCSNILAGAACGDAQWPGACCINTGYDCLRFTASYWECRNSPYIS